MCRTVTPGTSRWIKSCISALSAARAVFLIFLQNVAESHFLNFPENGIKHHFLHFPGNENRPILRQECLFLTTFMTVLTTFEKKTLTIFNLSAPRDEVRRPCSMVEVGQWNGWLAGCPNSGFNNINSFKPGG